MIIMYSFSDHRTVNCHRAIDCVFYDTKNQILYAQRQEMGRRIKIKNYPMGTGEVLPEANVWVDTPWIDESSLKGFLFKIRIPKTAKLIHVDLTDMMDCKIVDKKVGEIKPEHRVHFEDTLDTPRNMRNYENIFEITSDGELMLNGALFEKSLNRGDCIILSP